MKTQSIINSQPQQKAFKGTFRVTPWVDADAIIYETNRLVRKYDPTSVHTDELHGDKFIQFSIRETSDTDAFTTLLNYAKRLRQMFGEKVFKLEYSDDHGLKQKDLEKYEFDPFIVT